MLNQNSFDNLCGQEVQKGFNKKKLFDTTKTNQLIPGVFYFANFFRLLLRGFIRSTSINNAHYICCPAVAYTYLNNVFGSFKYMSRTQCVYNFSCGYIRVRISVLFSCLLAAYTVFFCLLHYSQSVSRSVAFLRSIRRAKISNPLACGRRRKTKILYNIIFFVVVWLTMMCVVVMVAACGESNEYLCLWLEMVVERGAYTLISRFRIVLILSGGAMCGRNHRSKYTSLLQMYHLIAAERMK